VQTYGSQGQQKNNCFLSVKLAGNRFNEEMTGESQLLYWTDVLSELDDLNVQTLC